MATKTLYATGSFKYQHRMLKAGDPVEMDAPTARLYEHLGKVSEAKPRVDRAAVPAMTAETVEAPKAPAKPRKRAAKKK